MINQAVSYTSKFYYMLATDTKLQLFLNRTIKNAETKAYHTSKDIELIIVTVFEWIPTKKPTWQEVINS